MASSTLVAIVSVLRDNPAMLQSLHEQEGDNEEVRNNKLKISSLV